MMVKTNRLLPLEGLRGVAAVIVVIFHSLLIFYPSFFYGSGLYTPVHGVHFEDNIYGTPFTVFLSGAFAVSIFFVISGFVLTVGFFQAKKEIIIKKLAAKRYLRLMIPAATSVIIVWVILSLHLDHFKNEAELITHSMWLAPIWNFTPSLSDAISQGLWAIFSTGDAYYNPVLWTMKYELIGSFLVFGVSLLFHQSKYRWIIYILLILGTFNSWYLGFVLGMILADLYSSGKFPFRYNSKAGMIGLLIIGLVMGGYPQGSLHGTLYETLKVNWLTNEQNQALYMTLGAALVMIAILTLPRLARFFGSRLVSSIGKYTYSLYLIHMSVLFTVCVGLFVGLYPLLGYNKAAILSIVITLPVIALITYWFEKYVDAPSIRLSGVFANWLLGTSSKATATNERPSSNITWLRRSYNNLIHIMGKRHVVPKKAEGTTKKSKNKS